jgi:hypothetical protein
MSSSNLVKVNFIEETILGETPAAGNFKTARFVSESLSGTPETTESAQIRTDRLSSGQVVTGLTVGGELSFEAAKEAELELFMASAMLNNWAVSAAVTVDLEIDATLKTLTRSAGDFNSDVEVGDFLILAGFASSLNNVTVMVASIDSATEITYVGPEGMVDGVGLTTSFKVADKLTISTTKKSFSMQKSFEDLTEKAIIYKGMLVSTMNLSINYGEIVNGSFGFSGTNYLAVDAAADFITDSRVVDPSATTQSLNGSIDMPFIASSAVGVLSEAEFCIQSAEITLDNNLTPQTCIGEAAPVDYSAGTAAVGVSLNAYLSDDNWAIIAKKLTQEAFAVGFLIQNFDGAYGFFMPSVQVSFDDPQSGGANQDVFLNMSGTAKVGDTGESSLKIFRIPAS